MNWNSDLGNKLRNHGILFGNSGKNCGIVRIFYGIIYSKELETSQFWIWARFITLLMQCFKTSTNLNWLFSDSKIIRAILELPEVQNWSPTLQHKFTMKSSKKKIIQFLLLPICGFILIEKILLRNGKSFKLRNVKRNAWEN